MDATREYHTKSARERPTLYGIIYLWILKYDQKETHRQRTDLVLPRGRGCTGSLGLVNANRLLHLEQINNKVLMYSTGKCIQYPVINDNGKEHKKYHICVYNWVTSLNSRGW